MLDKIYDNIKISGGRLDSIKKISRKHLKKEVKKVFHIRKDRVVYKVVFMDGSAMRLDIGYNPELTRIQIVATDNNIEIPKVIKTIGVKKNKVYKFSEWIEGVMLMRVWDLAEVFYKSGCLFGRLNLVKDPVTKKFISNSEFSSSNAVWTKDKRVFIIDHGRFKLLDNTDISVVQVLLKRIRNKERIKVFLDGYSKYKDIKAIQKEMERRNWEWVPGKKLHKCPPLKY